MTKYENFTEITQRDWLKMKKIIPNRSIFDIWIPNQRVCLRWKRGGSTERHIPTDSDKRCPPPPCPPHTHWKPLLDDYKQLPGYRLCMTPPLLTNCVALRWEWQSIDGHSPLYCIFYSKIYELYCINSATQVAIPLWQRTGTLTPTCLAWLY